MCTYTCICLTRPRGQGLRPLSNYTTWPGPGLGWGVLRKVLHTTLHCTPYTATYSYTECAQGACTRGACTRTWMSTEASSGKGRELCTRRFVYVLLVVEFCRRPPGRPHARNGARWGGEEAPSPLRALQPAFFGNPARLSVCDRMLVIRSSPYIVYIRSRGPRLNALAPPFSY